MGPPNWIAAALTPKMSVQDTVGALDLKRPSEGGHQLGEADVERAVSLIQGDFAPCLADGPVPDPGAGAVPLSLPHQPLSNSDPG